MCGTTYRILVPKVKWVKVAQSCPTLCNPVDYTVHGILQARILEWVAFPFSRGSSQPRDQTQVSSIAGGFFTSWATRKLSSETRDLIWAVKALSPNHWAAREFHLFLKCNWPTTLCYFLLHNIVVWYFYTFQNDYQICLATICHHIEILHSYCLYSPHCTFQTPDSVVLQLEVYTSQPPLPILLALPHPSLWQPSVLSLYL